MATEGEESSTEKDSGIWAKEFDAARKALEKFHRQGDEVVKRFRDDRGSNTLIGEKRLNLFTSDVLTKQSMLYGQTPKVTVGRRFADPKDDIARVAGEMLERHLNTDIERGSDTYAKALQHALEDRLLPGFGLVRLRYEVDATEAPEVGETTESEAAEPPEAGYENVTPPPTPGSASSSGPPAPGAMDGTMGVAPAAPPPVAPAKTREAVCVDYVHWKDCLWNPSRTPDEMRWMSFKAEMSRGALRKRFGAIADRVPLNAKRGDGDQKAEPTPWDRAEVWEIWCREDRTVYWYVEGCTFLLDTKPDPLGLEGFFPCPEPMLANVTTTSMVPVADYVLFQDQYNEIDGLTGRITQLQEAVRVTGAYDGSTPEIEKIVEGGRNKLYPSKNWAAFSEKRGLSGAVDWLPIEPIVNAMMALRDYRSECIELLHQANGMADIMRGQASTAGASATEQAIKAKFGSVRMQRQQDEFARFASDVLRLKAEIIAKHFDVGTIIECSNAQFTADAQIAMQAAQLIKDRHAEYRIEVKPEAVSIQDFAQLKQDRVELVGALAQYFTAVGPLAQQMPTATPFLLEIGQWVFSGFRGASQIEGVFDRAIAQAEQAAQQPQAQAPPDPKLQQLQLKGQLDIAKVNAELEADKVRGAIDAQTENAKQEAQTHWNLLERAKGNMIDRATKPPPMARPAGSGVPR